MKNKHSHRQFEICLLKFVCGDYAEVVNKKSICEKKTFKILLSVYSDDHLHSHIHLLALMEYYINVQQSTVMKDFILPLPPLHLYLHQNGNIALKSKLN